VQGFIEGGRSADNRVFSRVVGTFAQGVQPNGTRRAPGLKLYGPDSRFSLYLAGPAAGWQSGYAEDCKSSYSGSIPLPASTRINDWHSTDFEPSFGPNCVAIGAIAGQIRAIRKRQSI
jgi:hypothetical protein